MSPTVSFGSICKLQNGRPFKPTEWSESGTPIIRIQNLNDEFKPFNHCNFEVEKRFHINSGDLLFSWSGTPGTSFGAFFWNRGKGFLNQHIFRVDIDEQCVRKNYLRYAINSKLDLIIDQAHGGVGLKHITKGKLEAIQIPLPPLEEQKRIAAILDKADAIRRKRQQAIKLADRFLRSVFLDMFGDPVTNPKGWGKKTISDIGEVVTGNTPSRKEATYFGEFIEWIKSDNINTPFHYLTKAEEYLSEKGLGVSRSVPAGSILVTCIAGSKDCIGNIAIADRQVAFNQQINAISPFDGAHLLFIYAQLLFNKNLVQRASTESMKGMVSKSKFSEIELIIPSDDLQRKFISVFKDTLEWINKSSEGLVKAEDMFSSITQRAFKGELTKIKAA